jgi:hypothetical protein
MRGILSALFCGNYIIKEVTFSLSPTCRLSNKSGGGVNTIILLTKRFEVSLIKTTGSGNKYMYLDSQKRYHDVGCIYRT